MKRLICATVACLLLGGTVVWASPLQGKSKKHAADSQKDKGTDGTVAIHVGFTSSEVTVLRTHYAPRYRNLPPGLQKKIARGGQLPPGWQKKFEPFPADVERQLPRLPDGCRRGVIDGNAVIYNSHTNVIIDVAVLF
jgi:hypothetical protein